MNNPPPRPALRRAADAEVHPARPGIPQLRPIPSRPEPAPEPTLDDAAPELNGDDAATGSKKQRRKRANTSDTLIAPARDDRAEPPGKPTKPGKSGKPKSGKKSKQGKGSAGKAKRSDRSAVALDAELHRMLAKQAKASGYTPDEVVTLLVRAWLES